MPAFTEMDPNEGEKAMAAFKDYSNIHHMLRETVERRGDEPAYRWFVAPGRTETAGWNECYRQVRQVSRSLAALGIGKGDKVTILGFSCYPWVLCDLAVTAIGAATVGIYHSLPAEECRYIVDHSDSVIAFAQNPGQLEKLIAVRSRIPGVRKVILFEGEPPADAQDWVLDWKGFQRLGEAVPEADIDVRINAVQPGDVAGIVYTSGTTGIPKGAMLTHDNITFTAQSVAGSVDWKPDDEVFLFLPLAHVFARTCVYTTILSGCPLTFTRSLETLAEDIRTARPHWFPSVPRVYEKVRAKVMAGVQEKGGAAAKVFDWALKVGLRVSDFKVAKQPLPPLLGLQYRLADRLVFQKIRQALGGRVRWCISGAAPLDPEVGRFFHAAGVLVVEGIGMTENTSFSNLNRFDDYRFGWVGPPGPGIEQKVGEDGEIFFRGRNVMKAYYKMPEETAATITPDGWLRTGDLGEIDSRGFLRITGRKKDILVTSGGKNIAPARIETALAGSRYVNQVCVVGDRKHYLTALVTLDMDAVADYARKQGIGFSTEQDLEKDPKIQQLIESEVAACNRQLASFETVKKVSIVPVFTIENGLLTPTMKLKKNAVLDTYRPRIEAMYGQDTR